jgi:hypothetical protein
MARRLPSGALIPFMLLMGCLAGCHRAVVAHPIPVSTNVRARAYCAMEPSAALARPGDVIRIHVNAVFPNSYPLTYYWTSEAGTLRGKGADMLWRPKGAAPAMYQVRVRVDDGHGSEAICTMQVQLREPEGEI